MKIAIFGSNKSWSIEKYYIKYLSIDHEVVLFDPTLYYKTNNLFRKVMFRYFKKILFLKVNSELIKFITKTKPNILWVFKGVEISIKSLKKIKKEGIYLANYNPDHPFIRTYASSGGKNIIDSITFYDVHFSYSNSVIEKIKNQYFTKVLKLPFAFEPSNFNWDIVRNQNEIVKICFVGNPDSIRVSLIKKIISWKFPIHLYGNGWEKYFTNNYFVTCCGIAENKDLYAIFRKYRVQLNIFRPHNINSHNMRTFEITGVGGIQLAELSEDHLAYFDEGKEIFLYHNDIELYEKLTLLLSLPSKDIVQIRNNVRKKSIENDYTYLNRSKLVSAYFNNNVKELS